MKPIARSVYVLSHSACCQLQIPVLRTSFIAVVFECGFRVTCTRCTVSQATQTNQPIKTDAPGNEEKTLDVTGDSHVAAASSQSEEGEETVDSQTSEPSQSADIPVKSCSKQVCRNYTLKSVRACA